MEQRSPEIRGGYDLDTLGVDWVAVDRRAKCVTPSLSARET